MRLGKGSVICVGMSSILLIMIAGCSTSPPQFSQAGQNTRNLTPGMVQARLKVGDTNQTEVLEAFGAPNIVTRDRSGQDVWTYDVQSMTHSEAATKRGGGIGVGAGGVAGNVPIVGGLGGSGEKSTSAGVVSSSTFTLMIKFDENQIVSDYRMQSTRF